MFRRTATVCAAGVLAGLLLAACRGLDSGTADGAEIRFHNWWNFYERGLERLAKGEAQSAREDFERALGLRDGAKFPRTNESWRARTYGLHFVEGYFPNRELGIACFRLGEWDAAERQIERSLQQTPSSRARFFLNQLRARRAQTGLAGPAFSLDASSRPVRTALRTRTLSGSASSSNGVAGLSIDGAPEFIELAETTLPFRRDIHLRPGTNTLRLVARDLAGVESVHGITWIADWSPPLFSVRRLERRGAGWSLEAVCQDDGPLRRVQMGGRTVYEQDSGPSRSEVVVKLELPDTPVLLEAEDEAGNRIRQLLPMQFATADSAAGRALFQVASAGSVSPVPTAAGADTFPPTLRLASTAESLALIADEYLMEGWAEDAGSGLRRITVQGGAEPWSAPLEGIRACFAPRLTLRPGTNHFAIVVEDGAGLRATKELTIIRVSPLCLDEAARLSLALPPIGAGEPAHNAATLSAVAAEFCRPPLRFQFLERNTASWEKLLQEQNISASDLADRRYALPIGKMLAADILVLLQTIPRDQGHEVLARVVETGDGRVICAVDAYDPGLPGALAVQAAGLAAKIRQRFPLLQGEVTQGDAQRALINVGSAQGLPEGARFVVLEGAQGESLREEDGQLVQLMATTVDSNESRVKVIAGGKNAVRPGDRIFAR